MTFIEPATLVPGYVAENGGGTFDAATLAPFSPADGYAVGMAIGTVAYQPIAAQLTDTMIRVAREWDASYVGAWIDDDGRAAIDPVIYVRDRDRAIALGRANRQRAIWDFAAGAVIPLEAV